MEVTMNDYGIIGTFFNSQPFLPLERVNSQDDYNNSRIHLAEEIIHKTETDVTFMESLYRNSNPNYYLGAWIVKAVTDLLLQFTMGDLPTIQSTDNKYADFCNNLWLTNQSSLYNSIRELGLFGQMFIYVGWDEINEMPTFRTLTKKNVVDIRYENVDNPEDITYIRFRDEVTEIKSRIKKGDDEEIEYATVHYDKIFWKTKVNDVWVYKKKMLKRDDINSDFKTIVKESDSPYECIPVVEFNQSKLSFDKVGHSDMSGAIKIISVYHQLMESTINNTLYNGQPTLKFTGIQTSPIEFVKAMYGDASLTSGDYLSTKGLYNVFGSYYLAQGEDVNWLLVPSTVGDTKAVLDVLFYILVQTTGVPEWALGAGMTGAWATVKQQSVPLQQKVKAKRLDMTQSLLKLNKVSYIVYNARTNGKKLNVKTFTSKIIWGDIIGDDVQTKMSMIDFMVNHNYITSETAVSLLNALDNPVEELKKAEKQVKDTQLVEGEEPNTIFDKYFRNMNNMEG